MIIQSILTACYTKYAARAGCLWLRPASYTLRRFLHEFSTKIQLNYSYAVKASLQISTAKLQYISE